MDIEFNESQSFNQRWIWLTLVAIFTLLILVLSTTYLLGDNETSFDSIELLTSSFIVIVVALFFAFVKLKTTVNSVGIKVSMKPFVDKSFVWTEINHVCVLKYTPITGVGIRFFTKYGTVYRMKGDRGMYIELNNGEKLLIGTQKEEELAKVVEFLQ